MKDFAVVLSLMRGFALCCVGCITWRVSLGNLALLAFEPTILNSLPSLNWKKSNNQTHDEAKTGGGGVILTWAYWDSFSHRSQRSLIPSELGTDSFIPYLHCWIFTSGTTSHPGVQSINQSMKRSMNQFIKSMNQIIK